MKLKLKDIKQIVEGVVKNALSEQEDPRFGRYKSSMTKTIEDYDIKKATMAHSLEMKKLSNALQDALDSGGAVKVMEISKQMEALNRQLEQEIEAIIRSNDADARPMEEQEEQEAPEMARGAQKVAQKLDKAAGLATSVAPITSVEELEQILTDVIGRLNPQKVTDQELKVALKNMYAKAQKKELR